jgi:hypothetical protein
MTTYTVTAETRSIRLPGMTAEGETSHFARGEWVERQMWILRSPSGEEIQRYTTQADADAARAFYEQGADFAATYEY